MTGARKALVVGIDQYQSGCELTCCVNDAEAISSLLSRNGDGSPNFSVKKVLNVETKGQLKSLIVDCFSGDDEIALFYFAGHGFIDAIGGYIVTPDCSHNDWGVSMEELLAMEPMAEFFNRRADRYDQVHLAHIDGGRATKDLTAGLLPEGTRTILDLGCGTGLELEAVYARFPDAKVTGIDMAGDMPQKLRERFPGRETKTVCGSYLDMEFGAARYDAVISVMSLHHLTPAQKVALFRRIRDCLAPGGVFLNCDYYSPTRGYEFYRRLLLWALRAPPGSVHFDIPLTGRHELALLRKAGFGDARAAWREGKTWVMEAK